MPPKPITHDRFLKGLQAGFDRMSQPKGSVSRASNLVLTRRGALKVSDGTQIITQLVSGLASAFGPITEIFLYQPTGGAAAYYGIVKTGTGCDFYLFATPTYGPANVIHSFPPTSLPQLGTGVGGGVGGSGSGGTGSSGFEGPTANGGVPGDLGPEPLILQFVNKMLLALGNGYPPYESDGTAANTTALTNTFSAVYPNWTPSTNFNIGDQVQVAAVNSVFTATQGGTSGTTAPAFPATEGQTVSDNNIIWKNTAPLTGSPAPPGAAHAEVYASSYWVGNTWPTMTANQLDGPSALRMSTLNNPNSWNPLNAIQIYPDDADQINGIKAFTVAEAGIAPQNFLMVFKFFSTYLIQGVFGASDFALTRLQTDLGCVASRTPQWVPGFGIMRLTHLGFGVTDGINDRLQDPEAIRPYLFPESTEDDITPVDQTFIYFSKAAQTANPPMYVCAVPVIRSSSAAAAAAARKRKAQPRVQPPPPEPNPPPTAISFSASPTSVTFGQVPPSVTLTLSVTVENMSTLVTNTGTFDRATLSNSQFSLVGAPTSPVRLGGGQSYTFQVTLNQPVGNYSATLYLYFTESASKGSVLLFQIPVTATVAAAPIRGSIDVVPPAIDFGIQTVAIPTSAQTIHIINNLAGGLSLQINSAVMSNPDFSLVNPPAWPQFVANNVTTPNTGLALQIAANPTIVGADTGTLILNTGNANFPQVVIPLTISGVPAPPPAVGEMTRIFCFDLVLKAWTIVDLPFTISAFKQFRTPGSQPITVMAGFNDSALRRWQAGDVDWDQGAANAGNSMVIHWGFTDAEVHTQGATVRMFHNQVIIRGDGGIPSISVTPTLNGYVQSTIRAAMIALGDGQFEARTYILETAANLSLEVQGEGPAVIESIDYNVQPKPAGSALVFS